MWCVAELNEDYIAKMEDVLEIYERPYNPQEPVVCLDEKPVTLHADVRPASPAKPGREARQDNEYERCGTANVFCAVEPKAGRHFTFATPDRSGFEFAKVAFELALQYPAANTIHLVMDNLNIHRRKSLTDLSRRRNRQLKSGTASPSTTRPLTEAGSIRRKSKSACSRANASARRRIPDLSTLRRETRAWNRRMNRAGTKSTGSSTAKPPAASSTTKAGDRRCRCPPDRTKRTRCRQLPSCEWLQGNFWNKRIRTVSKFNRIENGPDRDIEGLGLLNALHGGYADDLTWFKRTGQLR